MVFAHGFGCDQGMWRYVAPVFEDTHRVVLFDHVGAGGSDLAAWDPARYRRLDGYAEDVLQILEAIDGPPVVFVGHSVSAMIGLLAAARRPELFERLVLVGPAPGTSTTRATAAASPRARSTNCSRRWTATTWAGRSTSRR